MEVRRKTIVLSCIIGLSLFLSWPYCVFSMSSLFADNAHEGTLNNFCWIISLTTLIASLSIAYIMGNRLDRLLNNSIAVFIIAAIQVTANIAMAIGGNISGVYGETVVIGGAATTGIATSLLHLCWGRQLGGFDPEEVTIIVPIGYVSGFVETLLISLLPFDIRFPVVISMIMVAGLLLGLLTKTLSQDPSPNISTPFSLQKTKEGIHQSSIFSKVLTLNDYATLLLCFVGVSLVQDIYNPQRMADGFMFAFVMMVAAFVSIAFVEISLRISREITYAAVTRMLVPLCCLGLFLATFLPREFTFIAFAVVFSSMMVFMMFLWISGTLYQSLTPGGIARSLGLPLIVHYIGTVTGTLAAPLLTTFGTAEVLFFLTIVLSSLAILRARNNEKQEPIAMVSFRDLRTEATKRITEQYNLTEREAEIFDLYVKGRDSAYICKTCFISKNTVDTHLRHIYEKTGIRTKQGLIDLVENTERKLREETS